MGSIIRGKWRMDSLVGAGGMASVYAATHRNGQTAALKILHATLANEDSIRERFLREGYVANSVNHPGVVEVLDDDETEDGAPFLVMELLIGQTLSKRWKKLGKRMPIPEALSIAVPVLDCLAACHAAGVIHRDIKPPNVFLTDDGRVRILDFGVAQLRDATMEKTRTGTALGTPYYMSPEQAMGLVDALDGRADLFSVGAILHALVTGQRVHSARTENEALILAATTPVPTVARIDPDLPVEIIKLIDKSLAWDRRNRHADANEMREDVERTLAILEDRARGVVEAVPALPALRPAVPGLAKTDPRAFRVPSDPESRRQIVRTTTTPPVRPRLEPEPIVEETVDEDDPRVQKARELFKHLDRLLPTIRQLGLEHPATERAIRTSFDAFSSVLEGFPEGLRFKLRPYSFLVFNHTVWEPSAPLDTIPYNLFAAGMRLFGLLPGLDLDEFRSLLVLMMTDPGQDLPPEDDMVAALWDLGLAHVVFESTDPFADGDAGQREAFVDEADELESLAAHAFEEKLNLVEAKAMPVTTDRAALEREQGTSVLLMPLAIDQSMQRAFAPQFDVVRSQWTERYVDVVLDGLRETLRSGDLHIVFGSLRKSASDLVVAGRLSVAVELHRTLVDKMTGKGAEPGLRGCIGELTDAMFGGDTLRILLDRLTAEPELTEALDRILAHLSANELPVMLSALQRTLPNEIRAALLQFVSRTVQGREQVLADAIPALSPSVHFPLMELLSTLHTAAAREALVGLIQSNDIAVRIEAKILSAGSYEAAEEEIAELINDNSVGVRIAALRAVARHEYKRVLASVTRRIHSASFANLVPEERRELFATVIMLAPERGEALALDMAKKGGLFATSSRETSRVAAIDALGAVSKSADVAKELDRIAQSRWAITDDTRHRAAAAAAQIEARIAGGFVCDLASGSSDRIVDRSGDVS